VALAADHHPFDNSLAAVGVLLRHRYRRPARLCEEGEDCIAAGSKRKG
jgi:hypothetical protein